MWIKKPYKGYKGYRWIWQTSLQNCYFDETALNRPKSYTTQYCRSHGKGIRSRQYANPISAICIMTPNGNYAKLVNKRVECITLKYKAEFLTEIRFDKSCELYVDSRNLGLSKFGYKVKLCPKRQNPIERLFGYKTAIHKLPSNTPQQIVYQTHIKYLSKLFTII